MKYWLCVTNKDNWRIIKEKKIWGVPERRKGLIQRVEQGDLLVFYVKPKRVGGIFKASSKPFESKDKVFTAIRGEIFPHRVMLEPVVVCKKPIAIESVFGNLSFTKGRKYWTMPLRRGMFEIPDKDYETIRDLLAKK
jgi:predicted RNA-binding protein